MTPYIEKIVCTSNDQPMGVVTALENGQFLILQSFILNPVETTVLLFNNANEQVGSALMGATNAHALILPQTGGFVEYFFDVNVNVLNARVWTVSGTTLTN